MRIAEMSKSAILRTEINYEDDNHVIFNFPGNREGKSDCLEV